MSRSVDPETPVRVPWWIVALALVVLWIACWVASTDSD